MHKLIKPAIALLLVGTILAAAGCGKSKDAVATVNKKVITLAQFNEQVDKMKAYYQSQGVDLNSAGHQDLINALKQEALDSLIQESLLEQAAKEKGIKVTDKQVDEQLATMKAGIPEETFQEFLKSQNISEDKFKEWIKGNMVSDALYQSVTDSAKVDQAEVQKYYDENRDNLVQVKVRHILFLAQDGQATDEQKSAARANAEEVIKQLKAGADFASLAKEKSEDPGSKDNGGLYDYFISKLDSGFVPEFTNAALTLGKGHFSQSPVQSPYGYHVIKADDRKENFDELKAGIEADLLKKKQDQLFGDFYEQLEKEAKITRNLPEVPAETAAPEGQQPPAADPKK